MLWAKALHVIAVIAWMAALLYLPRLMVYHADSAVGSEKSETFKVMERRLLRGIAMPAMAVAWASGLWVAASIGAWGEGWFHAKLAGVALLTAFHFLLAHWVRIFASDRNNRSTRFYRAVNEVPTVLMVVIVILVIVKPL
jgi:putative membrane protein